MSILWTTRVWEHATGIKGTNLLVLLCLADHAQDETGLSWPSVAHIAERARCSERTVQRAIETLADLGWLTVERRSGHSSRYSLSMPVTPDTHVTPDNDTHVTPDILTGVTPVSPTPDTSVTPPPTPMSPRTVKEPSMNNVVGLRTQPQRDDTVSRDIPLHVQQHTLAFVTSPDEQARWRLAWSEVHTLAREWDPIAHLLKYLAKCRKQGRTITPEDWLAWFAEDEQDARAKARERAEQGSSEDLWEKQLRESQHRQRQEQGR